MPAKIKKKFFLKLAPKTRVFVMALKSVGSWFQTRGPATEKARSPSLSLIDCLTRPLLLAKRFDARPNTDAVVVRRFCRKTGALLLMARWTRRHNLNSILCLIKSRRRYHHEETKETNEWVINKAGVKTELLDSVKASILWSHHKLPDEKDNARNNARCTKAKKTMHGLDWPHRYVERTHRGRVNQNDTGQT